MLNFTQIQFEYDYANHHKVKYGLLKKFYARLESNIGATFFICIPSPTPFLMMGDTLRPNSLLSGRYDPPFS